MTSDNALPDRWLTDWSPSRKFPLYTRANAGEVLPDPCSPLGWTVVWEPGVNMGWRDCQISVGTCDEHEVDLVQPEVVGTFGGYLFINASMARLFGVRGPGLAPEMIDATYFGTHPDVPAYVAEPWHESPSNTEKLGAWMTAVMTAQSLPHLLEDREVSRTVRASRPDLSNLDESELVARMTSFTAILRRDFEHHLDMTAGTSIGPGALGAIAATLGDPSLVLTLITAIGDVDSALPSRAMWELSRLPKDSSEYRQGLDAFLSEYGSRGPNEWDIRSDTWETKPALAISLIDTMRGALDDQSPIIRNEKNAELRRAAEKRVRTALTSQADVLAQFDMALHSAHLYLAGRERAKTNIIKVVHEVRMAAFALAERTGYTRSQICMLLADELDAFASQPDEFRARLAQRERQYLDLFDLEPPFIVNGVVPPLSQWARRGETVTTAVVAGDVLTGAPGAPGVYTGKARIILDAADPSALEPGEVLVAPFTDPAWTPLFVAAGAVVVDVGAVVSHAIIVSRELGLACVVSATDATKKIPNGALITVDGANGTVTIVSMP